MNSQLVCVTGRGSVRRRFRWQDGLMSAHEDAYNGLLSEIPLAGD